MSKIKALLESDEIKIALGLGFCIILLAFAAKRILHVEIRYLYNAVPGLTALLWETLRQSKKVDPRYLRPLYWNAAMIISTLVVILLHVE
ncbi:MAG: Rab GDP-dissociation inhibitor [candidate division Zixibacteria bacterium]|nr:Rab GDP-dissociation inhibitor [candidate division Zixibacteria bacterium]MDH3936461.1 Rab GDP-dissociation inhibitor [candidate division Zixibacteria bacterium]MDH4033106.1 Rab GDP-dissociation inhibitor [candidate division Zixibacteria bacterium]